MYALQVAMCLSETRRDVPVSSRFIADSGKMPERFLLQVLRDLVSHGVLRSAVGVYGGYYLARSPDEITLLQIFDAFETPFTSPILSELPGTTTAARDRLSACVSESVFAARDRLEKFTIADLVL
jgi:Rrf2 family transcriptional regulator, cysteine metabolism repressor